MKRIESIKERISNYENAHTRDEETIAWRQVDAYAIPDIKYLVQRLEHYETTLKRIGTTRDLNHAHFIAQDALREGNNE